MWVWVGWAVVKDDILVCVRLGGWQDRTMEKQLSKLIKEMLDAFYK